MDKEEIETATKIVPVEVHRDHFDLVDDEKNNFGIPMWYLLRVKRNQVRMMNERGYESRKKDLPYIKENTNLLEHQNEISPMTLREDMSGLYRLKDNRYSRFGKYALVYYPELKVDKKRSDTIKLESKEVIENVFSMLKVEPKSNLSIDADPRVYGPLLEQIGGKYDPKKKIWNFPKEKSDVLDDFVNENQRKPYVGLVLIISYAGLMPKTKKELKERPEYHFEDFTYTNFSYIPIDHFLAADYKLLSPSEWDKVVETNKKAGMELNTKIIPKIRNTDVFAKYYGADIGDVFFIRYKNYLPNGILESKYSHIEYRVVIRDPDTVG